MVKVFGKNVDRDKFMFEDLCLTKSKEKEILDTIWWQFRWFSNNKFWKNQSVIVLKCFPNTVSNINILGNYMTVWLVLEEAT